MKKTLFPILGAFVLALSVASCGSVSSNATTTTDSTAVSVASDAATTLSVDTTSYLTWKGRKPGGEHFGKIFVANGTISVQDDKIFSGSVEIKMNSIVVEDLQGKAALSLKGHLENEDFFEVATYPIAKFELTDVPAEGLNINEVKELKGNLTLKDVTKNIVIPVESIVRDANGVYTIKSRTFNIDRSQWNVKYGSKTFFPDLRDKFIENDIELSFNLTAK